MSKLRLHIVSFDVPYPPNYGGVIDVFYKLRTLSRAGVSIRLHCFEYGRERARVLEEFCQSVHYYPRRQGWPALAGFRPYIVASRDSAELARNLLSDDDPILFEGLHTCGLLNDPRLAGRQLIYRESNIEHHYYRHLFLSEKSLTRKFYYLAESIRLKPFQQILRHASVMLAVSEDDARYLAGRFPGIRVLHLPSFHRDDEVKIMPGKGSYALYHGKLSVPENLRAAEYLVTHVWDDTLPELVIAGLDPPARLEKLVANRLNIRIIPNPGEDEMVRLIRQAHLNILVTFQPTGLKLKLLNALFNGRFCLVNPGMTAGTRLGELCTLADTPRGLRDAAADLFTREFTQEEIGRRAARLSDDYSNAKNGERLTGILTSSG